MDKRGQFDMSDKIKAELQAKLVSMQYFEQGIASKPAEDRSVFEQAVVDWNSKSFEDNIEQDRTRNRDYISAEELGGLLGLSKNSLRRLPLKVLRPYLKTPQGGFRSYIRFSRQDVISFLTERNPKFADYDFTEPLLSPQIVVRLYSEFGVELSLRYLTAMRSRGCGPEYVMLNARIVRYRYSEIINSVNAPTKTEAISACELIMQHAQKK